MTEAELKEFENAKHKAKFWLGGFFAMIACLVMVFGIMNVFLGQAERERDALRKQNSEYEQTVKELNAVNEHLHSALKNIRCLCDTKEIK